MMWPWDRPPDLHPTLLLYGERDEIIPPGPIERLWRGCPAGWGIVSYAIEGGTC